MTFSFPKTPLQCCTIPRERSPLHLPTHKPSAQSTPLDSWWASCRHSASLITLHSTPLHSLRFAPLVPLWQLTSFYNFFLYLFIFNIWVTSSNNLFKYLTFVIWNNAKVENFISEFPITIYTSNVWWEHVIIQNNKKHVIQILQNVHVYVARHTHCTSLSLSLPFLPAIVILFWTRVQLIWLHQHAW